MTIYLVLLNGRPVGGLPAFTNEGEARREMARAWRELRKAIGPVRVKAEGHSMSVIPLEVKTS